MLPFLVCMFFLLYANFPTIRYLLYLNVLFFNGLLLQKMYSGCMQEHKKRQVYDFVSVLLL